MCYDLDNRYWRSIPLILNLDTIQKRVFNSRTDSFTPGPWTTNYAQIGGRLISRNFFGFWRTEKRLRQPGIEPLFLGFLVLILLNTPHEILCLLLWPLCSTKLRKFLATRTTLTSLKHDSASCSLCNRRNACVHSSYRITGIGAMQAEWKQGVSGEGQYFSDKEYEWNITWK